jgi:hypothetical protein
MRVRLCLRNAACTHSAVSQRKPPYLLGIAVLSRCHALVSTPSATAGARNNSAEPQEGLLAPVIRADKNTASRQRLRPGVSILMEVNVPADIRMTRISTGWPDLTDAVIVRRVDGIATVVRIQR